MAAAADRDAGGRRSSGYESRDQALMLCMHGSKHVWSRLIWICDVAQLLISSPDLDWKEVIEEANQSGLWRSLALGVLLAHRVAGADSSSGCPAAL